jgi:hypothetical protein
MSDTSNIDGLMVHLRDIVDGFNFTRVGTDQSLGRDVANLVVARIAQRGVTDKGGISGPWPENSTKEPPKGGYKGYKERRYGVDQPNVRTGQMLSQPSLFGRTTVEAYLITMRYGTGEVADRTTTGVPLAKADTKRTDIEKAYFAHTGQSVHKIKRPFYEVDESDGTAVVEFLQQKLDAYIEATNTAV